MAISKISRLTNDLRAQTKAATINRLATIEKDTPIIPGIVADTVIQEVIAYFYDQQDAGEKVYKDKKKIIKELVKQAKGAYAGNKSFQKKIRGKGNKGRDALYSFMRHWLAALLKKSHSDVFEMLPSSFSNGTELSGHYKPKK